MDVYVYVCVHVFLAATSRPQATCKRREVIDRNAVAPSKPRPMFKVASPPLVHHLHDLADGRQHKWFIVSQVRPEGDKSPKRQASVHRWCCFMCRRMPAAHETCACLGLGATTC